MIWIDKENKLNILKIDEAYVPYDVQKMEKEITFQSKIPKEYADNVTHVCNGSDIIMLMTKGLNKLVVSCKQFPSIF